ncbi:MAG: hotdog fold thioesterase [Bacteroidetes bacterium]|nr:hotdog fold thioesterase [Bacteroidota bacterium]
MMIWKKQEITIESLNERSANTIAEVLDIQFIEIGGNYLKAAMPVDKRVHQPYGLLHGGASAVLAETVGSVASSLCIDTDKQICVGIEINCNHIKGKRDGIVTATAIPLHIGATTHVWDIKINDEKDKLICVSRLTVAILKKPN